MSPTAAVPLSTHGTRVHYGRNIYKPHVSARNKWLSTTQRCSQADDSHRHSICVDTYPGYGVNTLDGQEGCTPAPIMIPPLFPLYHLPWSNAAISFGLNGCQTHTRSLPVWTNTGRRWTSLYSPLKMGSKREALCVQSTHSSLSLVLCCLAKPQKASGMNHWLL